MSIVSLVDKSDSSAHWSPKDMMESEIEDIEAGENPSRKAIVLFLDDSEGRFHVSYSCAGLKSSEILSVLEIAKARILTLMGYVEGM